MVQCICTIATSAAMLNSSGVEVDGASELDHKSSRVGNLHYRLEVLEIVFYSPAIFVNWNCTVDPKFITKILLVGVTIATRSKDSVVVCCAEALNCAGFLQTSKEDLLLV